MIPERFPRGPGEIPRATVACYAVAVLTAVVAIAVGLFEGDGRSVAVGILAAIGLALFAANSVAAPLKRVEEAMAAVGRGDLETGCPVVANDEIVNGGNCLSAR